MRDLTERLWVALN